MPTPPVSKSDALEAFGYVNDALNDGFKLEGRPSAVEEGARQFNADKDRSDRLDRRTFRNRYEAAVARFEQSHAPKPKPAARAKVIDEPKPVTAEQANAKVRAALKTGQKTLADLSLKAKLSIGQVLDAVEALQRQGVNIERVGESYVIPQAPEQSYLGGPVIELVSRKDNTFCFGAFGDLHAGSKYTRWDVREDLVRKTEQAGAQCIFDTGNWIDGDARFNQHDLVAHGLEEQCQLLAAQHPRTKLPIYAVAGDDHEGWIAQREGVNVGRYCEAVMRDAKHNWTDLGYMEAHVLLKNANTGKSSMLTVVHPGGGSSYALSYSIQKIVESYEGGEKPHVGLYGHYHKLWAGVIRNVWVVQTGCQQDQTPFMRKKRLEAHVGGTIITLEQDPQTGAILAMTPRILRYFNRGFYSNRWSHHGPINLAERAIGR